MVMIDFYLIKSAFLLKNFKERNTFYLYNYLFFPLDSRNTKKLKCFYNQQTYFSQIVSKKSQNNSIIFYENFQK